ncbi:helix-turn-helix domain-containing protein [Streptomyces sp. NBC_01255]|uniref:helix-turn-helix domain-containing protein n=1 Tax=Streptomyces sp. NBC_01255 TaxID=2903798 RepID=UPI002E35EF6C|nr:helix-turn-helix domain-containing protein [Streptomyces sp. NBC_01255]
MAARPITEKDRKQVRALHAEGMSRNDIARKISRSPSTVSKLAADMGLSFDRAAQVAAATTARKADLSARRATMAETLQDVAEREIARMTQPQLYFEWGGKEHDYDERWQPEPTPADRRTMMATASAALDRSLKLVPPKDDGAAESRSVIGDLLAGLVGDYTARHGAPPTDPIEPEGDTDDAAEAGTVPEAD